MEEFGRILDELTKIITRLALNKKKLKLVDWKRYYRFPLGFNQWWWMVGLIKKLSLVLTKLALVC
jgi:hypothetical protein